MSLLNDHALRQFENLQQQVDLSFITASQKSELIAVLGLSDFISDALCKQPLLISSLFSSDILQSSQRTQIILQDLQQQLLSVTDEMELHRVLRLFRRKHMLIIAWRELLGKASLEESFEHLSFLADQLILQTMQWLYVKQCNELGTPKSKAGVSQPLYIFAMGKLGGQELNFSSDIDLIFAYPERGQTEGGRRHIDNQTFFIKLSQRIIAALHQITVDGFVYRVDMRLRPFGDSGPIVSHFAALEDYYQSHGREWERYAMVKARILGESGHYKDELEAMLKPFVYRRYIDFSAIESLRKMKAMISAEVRRKGLKDNIKLGMGGIREVEFVAQAFQLIRGGRVLQLQCKGLQQTLITLSAIGELPKQRAQNLLVSYQFLRRVENILQQIADKQTQTLPDNALDKLRLMSVLGFASWDDFKLHLQRMMDNVHEEFNWIIGDNEKKESDDHGAALWDLTFSLQDTLNLLQEKGLQAPLLGDYALQLMSFKEEIHKRPIGTRGQETLEKLLPKIVDKVATFADPVALIERLRVLLLQIMRRTAYLELLNENEGALNQLLKLCSASPLLSEQLARYPILLDELLDPAELYNPTPLTDYKRDLQQFMLRIPEEDMEQQMEALRQFKQIQLLYITAADIVGAIELPQVSDHLTYLSEALLDHVVRLAWTQLVEKYGLPSNVQGSQRRGFAVIGYGKMGGYELGYGSDLDLIFLHENNIAGHTMGPRCIDNQLFYLRFGQRIIHLFSTRTNSGILYEIDMRLRPSGESGPLVVSIDAYKKYLENDAWTWEHQALVRSRAVFGDDDIVQEFKLIREAILILPRQSQQLANDITEMRDKMRNHLHRAKQGEFDLKQSLGGMVDIEFIAQYLVLVNAYAHPQALCQWSDNLRIFASCKALGLLSAADEKALITAYCDIRDSAHRLTLNKQSRIVSDTLFKEDRQAVQRIWNNLFD
ncbi:bifunctional [glutamate--ammonia ligase]-adenylyl-L-tyrosine phosphorylase/[glutamate--ammonia-ligase] adenylyltransferase [Psychromonas sp. MME2]|uniref:bifunctional [glutamate--ammonia ligase]-adenylyl-L-tyrosine phosphorylase/[glutamate--ammonia-ligase] adenylyltransferase n=1 Tax=unclassified Psychromonas TaxID=2614957 RepID=UPI00339BE258